MTISQKVLRPFFKRRILDYVKEQAQFPHRLILQGAIKWHLKILSVISASLGSMERKIGAQLAVVGTCQNLMKFDS